MPRDLVTFLHLNHLMAYYQPHALAPSLQFPILMRGFYMQRRQFIMSLIRFSAVALFFEGFLSACGKSDYNSSSPATSAATSNICPNGTAATVPSDPLHMLTVPREDVLAGVQKTYHIQGQENHDHLVTLTPTDFANLSKGMQVNEISTVTLNHQHTAFVQCV